MTEPNVTAPSRNQASPNVDANPPIVPSPGDRSLVTVSMRYAGTWRGWTRILLVLGIAVLGGAGAYWWMHRLPALPPGIASGNGRIEADPIDIETKFAGRVATLKVDEGDMVKAGDIVAEMDVKELTASLKKAEAQVNQARKSIDEALANVEQQRSLATLAEQEMERARALLPKGTISRQAFDQRQQQFEAANAALAAARFRVTQTQHALEAAQHDVELYQVNIADNTLVAPRDGRIQYRIANVGEVLPAGGKIFTMLDISYVYMDIYLPTEEAGRIKIGTESRILLDAYPDHPIPAKVTFIATQAQFTPKAVETKSERDKLMFRIRVRIDPERLRAHADAVRSGLPGVAYVRFDPKVNWPAWLQGNS